MAIESSRVVVTICRSWPGRAELGVALASIRHKKPATRSRRRASRTGDEADIGDSLSGRAAWPGAFPCVWEGRRLPFGILEGPVRLSWPPGDRRCGDVVVIR